MDFINDTKHLRLSGTMLNSRYYNYVLSPVDCRVFEALWNRVLAPKGPYYKRGQLVVNVKQTTLIGATGVPKRSIIRSLTKLDKLGVIITIRQKQNNNRYLLGFRTKGNEWLLLLYHLINKYEDMLSERVEEQLLANETPDIGNPELYKISDNIKKYIIEQFNSNYFFNTKVKDDKSVMEVLFHRNDYFYTPSLSVVKSCGENNV